MPKLKYFEAIKAAQAQTQNSPKPALDAFDFSSIAAKGFSAKLKEALFRKAIQPIYTVGRAFFPVMHLAGIYHICREAQVRDVLSRPDEFCVPFGPEMAELAGGSTFALGVDGPEHGKQNALLRKIINPAKDMETIASLTNQFAAALLENSHGRIDVINDLIKRTVSEVCIRYFGFAVDDSDAFADWTISASALLFGDPTGDPKVRKLALNGSARLCAVFDESIRRAQLLRLRNVNGDVAADTVVDRLVALQHDQSQTDPISDGQIRAILFGLVSGFIPTNTLAAGKMLDALIQRPDAYKSAVAAAKRGAKGREALKLILLEAGRLNPTLSPGQWRYCPSDATIDVNGKSKKIPAGSVLMVSTMSAMRDKRAISHPKRFWPDRVDASGKPVEADLLFGGGVHHCVGKYLAIEQITETFMVLLAAANIRPTPGKAGKLKSIGPYCRNLEMIFDTPSSQQSMFLVIVPVTSGASKQDVDAEIALLGHPAIESVREALEKTDIVHFCSLATIKSEKRLDIIWELNVDGAAPDALATIADQMGGLIRPIFAHGGLAEADNLAEFLTRHVVKLHSKPWGPTGVNFSGTGEFSVSTISEQAKFTRFVEKVLADFLRNNANLGNHPMLALNHVRRILSQDRIIAVTGAADQRALMAEAAREGYDAKQLAPMSATLQLSKFQALSGGDALRRFAKSSDSAVIWVPALFLTILFGWLFWQNIAHSSAAGPIWIGLSVTTRTVLATIATLLAVPAVFLMAIRLAERRDISDNKQSSLAHIKAIERNENTPGYAQNHIMAVGELKAGKLRQFTHAFVLWAIRVLIETKFRPGFIHNMGTIHYARWWCLPGTNIAAFYSNFDGSWESYLEDFITRTNYGMTGAWSNWKGFPPTRFLVFKGATDGSRFKRWVRTQQQAVPFWYSRFPTLSTDQIRNNALIHNGIARARSNSEAEEWLRCFGSMPRVENRIESDEVQALAFTGLKQLKFSTCLTVQLPDPGVRMGEWLSWVRGQTQQLDMPEVSLNGPATSGLMESGVIVPVYDVFRTVSGYALANSLTITFGDRPLVGDVSLYESSRAALDPSDEQKVGIADASQMARRAIFFGCSAAGIAKFDAPNMAAGGLSEGFPSAFRIGMADRGQALGDIGSASARDWRWGDTASAKNVAEAVLFIYAETKEDLTYATTVHAGLLENYGGRVINVTDCAPARIDQSEDQHDFEHFGYRDGISQPVIKGTQRSLKNVPVRDIVEPGEFILGYADGQGFFPPSPLVPPEADTAQNLPQLSEADLSRFPDFGSAVSSQLPRDFGRNGSFLVIRELKQDVDGFETFTAQKAEEIKAGYRDIYKVIGQYPDKEWVKAKLMGRWTNGRPVIGNPVNRPLSNPASPDFAKCSAAEHENDFTYGADDPQGTACPFGSHIRRSNPRDSKQPGDETEQKISNRHRLLRRGRTYVRKAEDGNIIERGLLFVSLCSDLERQFEFVQQVWCNSPSFHGLANETDPILGADAPDPETGSLAARNFTIPTAAGSIKLTGMQSFVQVMAGGYFFMPSRSALTYLTEISLSAKAV